MESTVIRSIAIGAAISAIGALGLGAQGANRSSAAVATPVLPYYSAAPVGESEKQILEHMSDANILGHMAMMDSLEIVLSDWATNYSKSDAITSYAKAMDARYRNNLDTDHKLGQQTSIGTTVMAGDLNRSHVGPEIDSVMVGNDLNLDRHYMLSQLQIHQHMLWELQTLEATARHPRIREHIASQIPIIQDELNRAKSIAVARGFISKKNAH